MLYIISHTGEAAPVRWPSLFPPGLPEMGEELAAASESLEQFPTLGDCPQGVANRHGVRTL